jgi:hypothetical protein
MHRKSPFISEQLATLCHASLKRDDWSNDVAQFLSFRGNPEVTSRSNGECVISLCDG